MALASGGAGGSCGSCVNCGGRGCALCPMPGQIFQVSPSHGIQQGYNDPQRALLALIGQRLHRRNPPFVGFEFVAAHETAETVFVFVIAEGRPVTLEDEAAMFPSDALITQLRLLAK